MSARRGVGLALLLGLAASVHAQDDPPKGPADIIRSATKARAVRDQGLVNEQSPSAPPPSAAENEPGPPARSDIAATQEPAPIGNDPHANQEGAPALARRPMASAEPSASVPVGSVRVHVLDANDKPVSGAQLALGTMSADAARATVPGTTGADGFFVYEKLATGDKQAYRVNVLYQGAKYSSTPFRLPVDRGYDVTVHRLDTTTDSKEVVLYVGATSFELKDERLKIVQQARLVNIGSKTYVFPEKGLPVKLPPGVLAFQSEDVMTDQHVREEKGKGLLISGSIPPGEVTLTWGFDVPQTDTQAEFTFDLPWVTFAYRVLADAAPGMTLEVDGMPPAELHQDTGHRFYVTEIVKRVGESPLRKIHARLNGIPGPGPLRYVAVGLALLLVVAGVVVLRASGRAAPSPTLVVSDLEQEKARLLARARELETERERGEIGPEFHARELSDLEEQLAAVLYEQARVAPGKSARA